ncbi:ligand-gated channel protein [Photobacterium sp. R1]
MSSRIPVFLPVSLAVAAAISASAQAQEQNAYTETMVVTASGFEQVQTDAPASISVITRDDLEKRYYRDLTDALRDVPGVVVTGGGGNTDISIRGMGAKYTLILVDGKRQSSRQTRPNSDSSGIEQGWVPPLQAIERIEVIRGPMSTLYGSDAIGGVINIITRKFEQTWTGNVQLDTIFQENRKSGDQNSANFFLNGPLGSDKLGMQLYGQVTQRDEDEIPHGFEDKDLRSVTSKLLYSLNDKHDLTLELGASEQNRTGTVGKSVPTEGCRGGCEDSEDEYRRTYAALTHQGNWGFATSTTDIQREINKNYSRQIEEVNTLAKTSWVIPVSNHLLVTGAEFNYAELDDQTTNQVSDRTHISNQQWAVFLEDEWRLSDSFSLTLGGRVDDDENFGSHFSPRAYGVWRATDDWTFKGGVSTGYRSPTLRDITPDWGRVSRGGNIYGNPDLKPETSVNTELAMIYSSLENTVFSLTVFYNQFEDKITRVTCPASICTDGPNQFGADPTYQVNIDEATTQGVELSYATYLTESLRANASYTYTDSEQKSGEYKGRPLNQLPVHLATLGTDWQATDKLSQWLKVTYRGKENDPVTTPSSSTITEPAYTFVDLGIGYQLTDQAKLKAAVYNVFDKEVTYEDHEYIEDGRRYWLGLDIAF